MGPKAAGNRTPQRGPGRQAGEGADGTAETERPASPPRDRQSQAEAGGSRGQDDQRGGGTNGKQTGVPETATRRGRNITSEAPQSGNRGATPEGKALPVSERGERQSKGRV